MNDPNGKRNRLAELLQQKAAEAAGPQPLAIPQERLWFLEQLEPGTALYAVPMTMRLRGALHAPALEQALNQVVRRQAALRTTFGVDEAGQPYQQVQPFQPFTLPVTDLRHLPPGDREGEARRVLAAEWQRPFDLANGPLARFSLFRLDEAEHWLLLSLHHIIADGWTMGVIFKELAAFYGATLSHTAAALPALPLSYTAFARRQREQHAAGALAPHLAYWQAKLAGAPGALDLPTDRPRPASLSYRGDAIDARLPKALGDACRAVCRREGVTPFMALLAVYLVLLHRYSRQDEITVGTPIAGRTSADVEGLAGLFMNTLVLRVDLSGDPSFRELLRRVRETVMEGLAHQEAPFAKLVEVLHPDRYLGSSPLFQVMFALENAMGELRLPGLQAEMVDVRTGTAKFDLSLWEREEGGDLKYQWEFRTDLFDADTIRRMAGHYENLLRAALADPGQPIGALPLLSAAERSLVVESFNQTAAAYPRERCVHELVAVRAAEAPDRVAVVCGDRRLTYGELERQSNRLARYLQRLGVGPDGLVGIAADRSPELIVAMLAVLKAGGAYVPMDPSYPRERLAYMLQDTGAKVILTHERLKAALPACGARLVCLDADVYAAESSEPVVSGVGPEHLSYVIYTSGSTGKPKGVQLLHRGLTNVVTWMVGQHGFTADDVMLAETSISFDIAETELYLPLTTGGMLVLADREAAADGAKLAGLIARHGVTFMQGTPATYRILLASGWQSRPGLTMIVGGEPLPRDLADRIMAGGGALWDQYGPTETTIWSTYWRVAPTGPILIGRPVANTQIYLLDGRLNPVPVGVPGELYIGGEGLARGYLNRPDLTDERFLDTMFGRVYRTGDLARFLPSGEIEYLGRLDHQVKIRGYRIELGEIEAVLEQHPGVAQAVVTARPDGSGEQALVAYYVPGPGAAPTVSQLRAHLQEQLPAFMVPSCFMALPQLPLTGSGKVDRRALPVPDGLRPSLETAYEPPASGVEQALADIWAAVLQVERVGRNDNFFDLGGHSLNATQVIYRVQEQLGAALPVRAIFEAPVLGALAARVAEALAGAAAPAALPFDPALLDGDTARQWLDRLDALTDAQIEALLGVIAAKNEEAAR